VLSPATSDVAKIVGITVAMAEKHYTPFVPELRCRLRGLFWIPNRRAQENTVYLDGKEVDIEELLTKVRENGNGAGPTLTEELIEALTRAVERLEMVESGEFIPQCAAAIVYAKKVLARAKLSET
jgi:hypothetical protein